MSDTNPILLDIADGVATITINRPQVKNSLNIEALSALFTALGTCEDRSEAACRPLDLKINEALAKRDTVGGVLGVQFRASWNIARLRM